MAGTILPAYDVGGDWIDHCETEDGAWLAVADAVGKGPQAEAIGAIGLAAYRAVRRSAERLLLATPRPRSTRHRRPRHRRDLCPDLRSVTNAIVLPVSGWLSNRLGRKRYFWGSIVGSGITSLLCGLAPTPISADRGARPAGRHRRRPATDLPQAILADTFRPEKRGQAFAAYGLAVVFAPAIGPTVGGWITDNFSWRWVFLLNVPVAVILDDAGDAGSCRPAARDRRATRAAGRQHGRT